MMSISINSNQMIILSRTCSDYNKWEAMIKSTITTKIN